MFLPEDNSASERNESHVEGGGILFGIVSEFCIAEGFPSFILQIIVLPNQRCQFGSWVSVVGIVTRLDNVGVVVQFLAGTREF